MANVTEYIYKDTSGTNDIQLQDDSSGVFSNSDSSGWTRLVLSSPTAVLLDSSVNPEAIEWDSAGLVTLKPVSLIEYGIYKNCKFIAYSPNYQDGVVYGGATNGLTIKVL